ncbi:MAG: hypothetical protein QXR88_01630, partial [Candidatus Pacearchaeota archaeon]
FFNEFEKKEEEEKVSEIEELFNKLNEIKKIHQNLKLDSDRIRRFQRKILHENLENKVIFNTIYEILDKLINKSKETEKSIIYLTDILESLVKSEDSHKLRKLIDTFKETKSSIPSEVEKSDEISHRIKRISEKVEIPKVKKFPELKSKVKEDISKKIDEALAKISSSEFSEIKDTDIKKEKTEIKPTELPKELTFKDLSR